MTDRVVFPLPALEVGQKLIFASIWPLVSVLTKLAANKGATAADFPSR